MTSCAECGFNYEDLPLGEVADALEAVPFDYRAALAGVEVEAARKRPEPTVWSAIEYVGHVRDVLFVQRERVVLAQVFDRPDVTPMSRDERVAICRYGTEDLPRVLDERTMVADLPARV